MNGNNLNKNNGQVLLLLVLVLGTLLIVAMTAIFQSTTSTQIGSIEQQSQVTLAAAEAAIEKALQSGQEGSFKDLGLNSLTGISLENSQVEITEERPYIFHTPKLDKDEQYTFYLAEYTGSYPNYFGDSFALKAYMFYESGNLECTDIAMEVTVLYDAGGAGDVGDGEYEMEKYLIDPGDQITTDNSKDLGDVSGESPYIGAEVGTNYPLEGKVYNCRTALFDTEMLPNMKMMFVQTFFRGTKIAFAVEGYEAALDTDPISAPTNRFPSQGRLVTATARANISANVTAESGPTPTPITGLTRTAQIFQSYPQIPAEFWVTSF